MGFRLSRPGRTARPGLHELVLRANPLFERASAGAAMLEPLGVIPAVSRPYAWWNAAPWQAPGDPPADESSVLAEPVMMSEGESSSARAAPQAPTVAPPPGPERATAQRVEQRAVPVRRDDLTKATASPSMSAPPVAPPAVAAPVKSAPPAARLPTRPDQPDAPMTSEQESRSAAEAPGAPAVRKYGEAVREPALRPEQAAQEGPPARPAAPPARVPHEERGPRRPPPLRTTAPSPRVIESSAEPAPPAAPHSAVPPAVRPISASLPEVPAVSAEQDDNVIDPAALFTNRDEGRSPLEWLGRLQKAAEEEAAPKPRPVAGPASAAPGRELGAVTRAVVVPARPARVIPAPAAAQPVAQSARRFLQPLVGIDPAGVAVHRGAPAAEAIAGLDAEAAALPEQVIIGPEPENTPAGLGLLAHELTHVARARNPAFVPPVIAREAARSSASPPQSGTTAPRGADAPSRGAPDPRGDSPKRAAAGGSSAAAAENDEAIALAVENRVRQLAGDAEPSVSLELPDAASGSAAAAAARRPSRPARTWDGLPAPWEPMPPEARHMAEQAADAPITPSLGRSASPTAAPVAVASGATAPPTTAAAGGATAGVQRAARDRKLDPIAHAHDAGESSEEHPAESDDGRRDESSPGSGGGSAPDLDGLARQVYAVLRRRLAAERRRAG